MLELYDSAECPFCQKVRIVLAEKDLSYNKINVDLDAGEQRRPEFLRLNPFGKVPVLRDEEAVIYDSTIIDEYLEDEYPHPPLMPTDSWQRARVRILEDLADNVFLYPAGVILEAMAKPAEERAADRVKQAQAQISWCLATLDRELAGKKFLGGEIFSLADAAFAPRIAIIEALGVAVDPAWTDLAAWLERLRERPSVRALEGLERWQKR